MPTEDGVDGDDNSPECLKFGRFKPLSRRQLHETLGHYGKCPWGCLICLQVKKSMNKVYKTLRPKHDFRPGYTWHIDIIYWSFGGVSVRGFTYTLHCYGGCEGSRLVLNLGLRGEAPPKLDLLITTMRADKRFKQAYPFFSCVHLDLAGEFLGEDMMAVFRKHNITEVHWKDPSDKRDNGLAELTVGQFERAVKKTMLMTSSPAHYFCYHVDYNARMMNRLPLVRNINSIDGEARRPLEELFSGGGDFYSREQCNRDLHALNVPCQLALVTDKDSKGIKVGCLQCRVVKLMTFSPVRSLTQ